VWLATGDVRKADFSAALAHDDAVSSFGRNDSILVDGGGLVQQLPTADSSAALRNDKQTADFSAATVDRV
jgi:hypothetical protein